MNHNQIRRRLATIAFGIVIAAGSVASAQAQRRLATIAFGIVIAAGSVASAQAQREPAAPFAPSSGTTSPSVYATTTVKDFLVICGNDQGGCADEVGMALDYKMVMDGTANICLPGAAWLFPWTWVPLIQPG